MALTKLQLFYVTFDGLDTLYCGVGTTSQYFLAAVKAIRSALSEFELEVHFICPETPRNGFGRCTETIARSRVLANENRIFLHRLSSPDNAANSFGNSHCWPNLCEEAAHYIYRAHEPGAKVLVLLNDTPFAGMCRLLPHLNWHSWTRVIWIAHSTAKVWGPANDPDEYRSRCDWEASAVEAAHDSTMVLLGAICGYMKNHLEMAFGASTERIVDFTNGICPYYLERFTNRPEHEIQSLIARYSLPVDRPLFLAFGRASFFKGLDKSADIGRALERICGAYPIIFAKDYGTEESKNSIASLHDIGFNGKNGQLITEFQFEEPRILMQSHALRFVSVMSNREPFGLIPSEARLLNRGSAIVIASDSGGLSEQVVDGSDGVLIRTDSAPELICEACNTIGKLEDRTLMAFARAARSKVLKKYSLGANLIESIRTVLREA